MQQETTYTNSICFTTPIVKIREFVEGCRGCSDESGTTTTENRRLTKEISKLQRMF